ncbi:MAG: chemotaxis protein CheW [Rhodospirillaceae bacterium]
MASLSQNEVTKLRTENVAIAPSIEQYIIFTINEQEYGISIMAVREIRGWTQENRLPNLPHYIRGVINLRGVVIPIIDLRTRFGGSLTDATKIHVVIVMQVGENFKGVLVDAISDIVSIPCDQIKPAPGIEWDTAEAHYVSGLYTPEGRIIALLSVTDICSTVHHHLTAIESHGSHSSPETILTGTLEQLAISKPN